MTPLFGRGLEKNIIVVKQIVKNTFSFFLLLSVSLESLALGLGVIRHHSFLGEPLDASVEVIGATSSPGLQNLRVHLVTPEAAEKLGIELLYSNVDIRAVLLEKESGEPYIRLFSRRPISEPYTDVLLKLEWPAGSVFREYAILLDIAPVTQSVEKNLPQQQTSSTQNRVGTAATSVSKSVSERNDQETLREGEKYRVRPGDTFNQISRRVAKAIGAPPAQVANWLYENNTRAFINNDINKLSAGALLALPAREQVANKSTAKINSASQANHRKANFAGQGSTGGQQTQQEVKGTLRLSRGGAAGEEGDAPKTKMQQINEQFDGTQEMLALVLKENAELKKRVEKLEGSEYIDTLKELILAQNQQIEALKLKLGDPENQERSLILNVTPAVAENKLAEQEAAAEVVSSDIKEEEKGKLIDRDGTILIQASGLRVHWLVYLLSVLTTFILAFYVAYRMAMRIRDDAEGEMFMPYQNNSIEDALDKGLGLEEDVSAEPTKGTRNRTLMDLIEEQQKEKRAEREELEQFTLVAKGDELPAGAVRDGFISQKEGDEETSANDHEHYAIRAATAESSGDVAKESVKDGVKENATEESEDEESINSEQKSVDVSQIMEDMDFSEPAHDAIDIHATVGSAAGNVPDEALEIERLEAELDKLDTELIMEDEVKEVLSMVDIYCGAGKYNDALEVLEAQYEDEPDERIANAIEHVKQLVGDSGEEKKSG